MKNKLDLQIKSELENSKPQIPNGYEKKIADTLEKTAESPKVSKKKYPLRAAAVMACIILTGTGSIYAAKNYLGDRAQSSIMGADCYSENLAKSERERLSLLDNPERSSVHKCKIDENDAVNLSRESIKNVFGMDVSESDFTIELQPIEEADKHYLVNFTIDTDSSISILIDADHGFISQMRLNCYDVYSENKVLDKKKYEECCLFIRQKVIEKTEADLKGVKLYYMSDHDHLLKNGTLKYIFELKNGAGYVINYSLNMEMIYYLRYIDDIHCFEKTMEGNEQELVLE